jgi:hypothetical protein
MPASASMEHLFDLGLHENKSPSIITAHRLTKDFNMAFYL